MTFHGYPQDPTAHPERPWWRGPIMRESDGVIVWRRSDSADTGHPCLRGALAAIDREDPLPPPEPLCGQVWVLRSGRSVMVVDVVPQTVEGAWMVSLGSEALTARGAGVTCPWPPPGAVLVAGPGAPWAPAEAETQPP